MVFVFQDIIDRVFQFPVNFIDKHEDTRTSLGEIEKGTYTVLCCRKSSGRSFTMSRLTRKRRSDMTKESSGMSSSWSFTFPHINSRPPLYN